MKKFKILTTQIVQRNITDFNLTKVFYLVRLALKLQLENLEHFLERSIPYHQRLYVVRKSYITYCFKTVHHFLKYFLYYQR